MFEKIIVLLSGVDCHRKNPIEYDILLRLPGQSLEEKLEDIRDKLFDRFVKAIVLFVLGLIAIIIFHFSLFYEILLVVLFFVFFAYLIASNIKNIRNIKLGRDGERSMAQYLNNLVRQTSKEETNMYVYHDIVNKAKSYNIDHVIVTKKGIFIVETKTYRKDPNKKNEIMQKGNSLYKNDVKIDKDIYFQVQGQAKWLQSELKKKTGKTYEIIPIIAFIGWYVKAEKYDKIYISSAKTINNIFENQYREIIYDEEELQKITKAIHPLSIVSEKNDICV